MRQRHASSSTTRPVCPLIERAGDRFKRLRTVAPDRLDDRHQLSDELIGCGNLVVRPTRRQLRLPSVIDGSVRLATAVAVPVADDCRLWRGSEFLPLAIGAKKAAGDRTSSSFAASSAATFSFLLLVPALLRRAGGSKPCLGCHEVSAERNVRGCRPRRALG